MPPVELTVVVEMSNGLHARTASAIREAVAEHDAEVSIVSDGGRTAPATDPLDLVALNVPSGDAVTVRATGPDAERAAGAVESVLTEGVGNA